MSNNRKKTTTKKRTSTSGKKAQQKSQDFESFHTEIAIWITIIAAVLLLLGNFGFCGTVGNVISSIFFGTFGIIQHVLPIVVLILIGLLFANQFSSLAIKKTILTIVFFCMISVISQMFVNFDETSVFAATQHAFENHTGGGFVGGAICILLNKFLGKVASVIITVMVMLISLMLIFERSILKLLKDAGDSTVQASKQKKLERQQKKKLLEEQNIAEPGTFRDNLLEEKKVSKKPGRPKKKSG